MLSFLAFAIVTSGRRQVRMAAVERLHAQLQAQADGGIWEAAFHLLDTSRAHWRADGRIHRVRQGRVTVEYRIVSEAGKVNPNLASPDLLAALLRAVGTQARMAQEIAANIRAWRFPLQQGSAPSTGSTAAYAAAGLGYGPPGAPFQTNGEIALVLGMTPVLAQQILPFLSVYWDADPVPSLAGPVVRQALAMAGGTLTPDDEARSQTIVGIDVVVSDISGTRALRHAVITTRQGEGYGSSMRILQWNRPEDY
ncbi:type II secretion system protein GspK [Komagataeibacter sp. FNDCR2]|uniref:type II secretion system protein GspK n=1 Tax=Komagataeibacter sp. FNDCR2 TaxID=2878682 RepID=UPI001E35DB6F|nr:type II secretion system protein GspK [Komagataeibacter sp. FNDCR2]MCE2574235.1 general secretion pathway protein GspK [Komagataeibacter sp. FNDCR2]